MITLSLCRRLLLPIAESFLWLRNSTFHFSWRPCIIQLETISCDCVEAARESLSLSSSSPFLLLDLRSLTCTPRIDQDNCNCISVSSNVSQSCRVTENNFPPWQCNKANVVLLLLLLLSLISSSLCVTCNTHVPCRKNLTILLLSTTSD